MEVVMLKGLYGSMITPNKAVAYCKRHGCHLTANTMKKHECLRKQCHAFDKHEDNVFWQERALKKALKKNKGVSY